MKKSELDYQSATEMQFLARQAIFDKDRDIYAYELLYRDSSANTYPTQLSDEEATGRIFFDALLLHGIEKISNNKIAFINLSTSGLLSELPHLLPSTKVVIEIVERTSDIDQVASCVEKMRQDGYVFALDDYNGSEHWLPIVGLVEYIKVEVELPLIKTIMMIKKLKRLYPNVKVIAEKIENYGDFYELLNAGADLFQGYFFTKPEMLKLNNITPNNIIILKLMNMALQDSMDFKQLERAISKDVSLTVRVLKLANGACRIAQGKIGSLAQAISYVGENAIRQFITVLALRDLGSNKPSELTRLGLTRAKFVSGMLESEDSMVVNAGYLVGLISILDAMLDKDIREVCEELLLSDSCKVALLDNEGPIGAMLQLVKAIEVNNFEEIVTVLSNHKITFRYVGTNYVSAMMYADQTLSIL